MSDLTTHCTLTPVEFTPVGKPPGYDWMAPKTCFDNAFRLATELHRKLRYGEGYALRSLESGSPVWVHHAWVVDGDGNAIDTTWLEPGQRYVGITVSWQELVAAQVRKGKKQDLVEPVLEIRIPLLNEIADATWTFAEWFIGAAG